MGRARGVVFGSSVASAAGRRSGRAGPWPSVGGRLLYAALGWLAPGAALTLGPFVLATPVTTGLLSALAVALLLAPRLAYLAAVGGTAALVAGAGLALGQAASADQLGLGFDALAAAVVTAVYVGAIILACLDWPISRPWSDPR
ncbi:MAG TPA: hypothetical protein VN771_08140 [Candidatus Baltobacteraceae bacterium]|nr:hypothetical protein [Candidatus Baltobacteraceae bacterium]